MPNFTFYTLSDLISLSLLKLKLSNIESLLFNIINNTSGINDFYEDYTATMYADITEGQTYSINVIPDDLSPSGSYAPEAINVYIDFNIDGDFDDLGEVAG